MKSSESVVAGSSLASSQWRRRVKSSACLRRVTFAHVEPKVAVYSAINGARATAGRFSCLRGNRPNEACEGASTPSCVRVSMTLYYVSLALPATIFGLDRDLKGLRNATRRGRISSGDPRCPGALRSLDAGTERRHGSRYRIHSC